MVVKVGLAESQLSATRLAKFMREIRRPVSGEVEYRRIESCDYLDIAKTKINL